MLIECHLTKTFVNVRSQMNRLMCPSSNILFSSPPLTPSFAWRSGNMASDTCRPSLVCWPASWPVGPWQRFWSWSSSSCSSTSPGWRSACLAATHKQRPINWALNIENYTQLCSTYSVKSAFYFLSPSAGFGGSSCRGSWRPARTTLYPPQSTRLGTGWSWPGRRASARRHVCAIITCREPEGIKGTRTGSGNQGQRQDRRQKKTKTSSWSALPAPCCIHVSL